MTDPDPIGLHHDRPHREPRHARPAKVTRTDIDTWLRSLGFDDPAPVEQLLKAEWNYHQLEAAFLAWKARRER